MSIPSSILAQFEVLNPRATALLSLLDRSGLEVCTTPSGEKTLLDRRDGPPHYFNAPSGPFKEALSWVSGHQIEKVDYLVVFGIGLGWEWRALLPWLHRKRTRRVVFLEDDLAVVHAFLSGEHAAAFFADPQSTLFVLEAGDEGKQVREIVTWYAFQRSWSCLASPAYDRYRTQVCHQLFRELTVQQVDLSSILSELFDLPTSPLRNFGRNLFLWQRSLNASSLFHAFRDCPAIVVGAGPSLEHDIEQLRGLDSRALILAGGSSVNALLQAGILPHMTASVDPNPMQYIRLRQAQPFCLPVLYRSRALHEALIGQTGPLLYLRGADGYPIVEWFERACGIRGQILDGGHSVANMIIEIAHAFGCRPIIMVGYDLAYTHNARYTQLVSESMAEGESTAFEGTSRGMVVEHTNYDGEKILTESKWVVEAQWIEQFQHQHPRLKLINTAPHGLTIGGAQRMSLTEALATFCSHETDVAARVHLALEEASSLSISPEHLSQTIHRLSTSLQETGNLLATMQKLLYCVSSSHTDSPELIQAGASLEKQLAFRVCLSQLFMMHTKLTQMQKCIDCRPFLDEDRSAEYDKRALEARFSLLSESVRQHLTFLYTMVAWGCCQGQLLPEAGAIVPLQGTEVQL